MKRRTTRSPKRDRSAIEAVSSEPVPISRERPVLELIQKLRSGALQASLLDAEDRRACVEHLTAEGYSVAETAQILGVSDRTITRDRNAIRDRHVLERDDATVDAMIGRLMSEYEAVSSRLKRIARDRGVAAGTRVEADRTVWSATLDLMRILQRLGYLPEAARELKADINVHGQFELPTAADLQQELDRLSAVPGASETAGPLLASLRERVLIVAAAEQLSDVRTAIEVADREQSFVEGEELAMDG